MTTSSVRILNKEGLERFRAYLHCLSPEQKTYPPMDMLHNPLWSEPFEGNVQIEQRLFSSRLDAARYLCGVFEEVAPSLVAWNAGLWSWLSLLYFDQVCPPDRTGVRRPGRDYRFVPGRYRYRHLLAGPYHVYLIHEEKARLLLSSPVHVETGFYSQLAERQHMISNTTIVEAASVLYYDDARGRPKPYAQIKGRSGTLPRFISVIQQLDVTYDLYGLTVPQLLSLLPPEFEEWKPRQLPVIAPVRP